MALHAYTKFKPWMLGNHPGNVTRACKRAIVRGRNHGLIVTATTDGAHSANSWHTAKRRPPFFKLVGRAVDFGTRQGLTAKAANRRKVNFQRSELRRGVSKYREIIGPDNNAIVLNGRKVSLAEGSALETQHDNHTHIAPIR